MARNVIILLLISLLLSDSTPPQYKADSDYSRIRSEIARMIRYGKDAWGKIRTVDLDSGIVKLDSAIALAEEHFGPSDTTIATALAWQGMLYGWKMDVPNCEALINRSLALYEAQLGPVHPAVATARWMKGGLYLYTRRLEEGRELILQASALLESHPDFDPELRAFVLLDVGANHLGRNEYLKAVAVRKKALELFTEVHGPDHWSVGLACQCIGFAYWLWYFDDYDTTLCDSAVVYQERAHEAYRQSLGLDMPRTAYHLDQLSRPFWLRGEVNQRREMLQRALAVLERTVGRNHLWVAEVLQQLAWCEMAGGHHDEAVLYAERASQLGIELDILTFAYWTKPLARSLQLRGDAVQSLKTYRELIDSQQDFVTGLLRHSSEESKVKYLSAHRLIHNYMLSLALETDSPEAIETALQMVLAGKSVIVDALAAERKVAYCSGDTSLTELLGDHTAVCGQLAGLITTGGLDLPSSVLHDTVISLNASKDRLESDISSRCAQFAEAYAVQKLTVQEVANAMPERSVLWEFCKYWPEVVVDGRYESRPPHYIVFTLQPNGHASLTDLGRSRTVDSLILELQSVMSEAPSVIAREGEARAVALLTDMTDHLYERLILPLESTLTDGSQIIVSADSRLNLLPFAVLTSSEGFLAEAHEITYLSSGRDLLDLRQPADNLSNNAIVVAAPDFDSDPETAVAPILASADDHTGATPTRGPSRRSECLSVPFDPLPATATEGVAVAELLSSASRLSVMTLTGSDANETTLKQFKEPPRLLHLATHGYFCSRANFREMGDVFENPLLYSGLAMAGSNRTIVGEYDADSRQQDGILTSLEVSGLNLVGTDLVVLSACQSGLGEVRSSEGVYGLRRAFQHAGARSIIMSMYDVPDQSTATLMERFYANWLSGSTKGAALRRASLSMLREQREEKGVAHPLFWGGFILVGDPN